MKKKTPEELRKWIDEASYEELFRKRRFAPAGDPLFSTDTGMGDYFEEAMAAKELHVSPGERVAISKRIGWDLMA